MPVLEQFTHYIKQIGYSKSSQYQIPFCVKEFITVTNKSIKNITQQDLLNFYNYLQTRPLKQRPGALSQAMINHYFFAIKTFFNWLETTGQIQHNPISNVKFKRYKTNTREPLTQEQIKNLFNATKTNKEKALLHLFYSCGLRRIEAENLNTTDIHFTQNLLYVREGKGAKRRVIPINEKVKQDLLNYHLSKTNYNNNPAFMLNEKGNRMKGDTYNKILKQLLTINNLPLTISLHYLRHSIATHLLETGLNIDFVKEFLGHTHLESTQIYTKVTLRNYEL